MKIKYTRRLFTVSVKGKMKTIAFENLSGGVDLMQLTEEQMLVKAKQKFGDDAVAESTKDEVEEKEIKWQ